MVGSGFAHRRIRQLKKSVAILAYHNIVPRGESPIGELSLHLPVADFADQLDRLCESHEVVPLDRAFEAGHDRTKPCAVITFDDAYLGAVTSGAEELGKRGLTATVFLNPGCLGSDGFWWDRLSDPVTGSVAEAVRCYALEELGGETERVLRWAAGEKLAVREVPDFARPAPRDLIVDRDTRELPGSARVFSFGSHTWSHAYLPGLDAASTSREIVSARSWMESWIERPSSWLSYPYGAASEGAEAVAAGQHVGALLVSGGRAPIPLPAAVRFRTPRINVPAGVSPEGFVLRLAGVVD